MLHYSILPWGGSDDVSLEQRLDASFGSAEKGKDVIERTETWKVIALCLLQKTFNKINCKEINLHDKHNLIINKLAHGNQIATISDTK